MLSPIDLHLALSSAEAFGRAGVGCGCTGILPGVLGAHDSGLLTAVSRLPSGSSGIGQALQADPMLTAPTGFTQADQSDIKQAIQTPGAAVQPQPVAHGDAPGHRPRMYPLPGQELVAGFIGHDSAQALGSNRVLYEKLEFCSGGKLASLGSVLEGFSRAYISSTLEIVEYLQAIQNPYNSRATFVGREDVQGATYRFRMPYPVFFLETLTGKPIRAITLGDAVEKLVSFASYQPDANCLDHAQSFAASVHRQLSEGVFGDCGAFTTAISTLAWALLGVPGLWVLLGDQKDPAQHIVNLFVVKDKDGHQAFILVDGTATAQGGQPDASVIGYQPPERFSVFSIINPNNGEVIASNYDPAKGVSGVACGMAGDGAMRCGPGIGYAGIAGSLNPIRYVRQAFSSPGSIGQSIIDETRRGLDNTGKLLEKTIHAGRKPFAQLAQASERIYGKIDEQTGLPLASLGGSGMGLPLLTLGPVGYALAGALNPVTQDAVRRAASGDLSAKRIGADIFLGLGSYYHAAAIPLEFIGKAFGIPGLGKLVDGLGGLWDEVGYSLNPDLKPRLDTPSTPSAPSAPSEASSGGGSGGGAALLIILLLVLAGSK